MNSAKPTVFLKNIPLIIVAGLTFLLLVYISFAEVIVKYIPFQTEKMNAQIDFFENPLSTYLNSGLPLEDFGAYDFIGENLIKSDEEITSIQIINIEGQIIYSIQNENFTPLQKESEFVPLELKTLNLKDLSFFESDDLFRITKNLVSKQRDVGKIIIENSKGLAYQYIHETFRSILYLMIILIIVFAILSIVLDSAKFKNRYIKEKNLKFLYLTEFLILSAFIIYNIIDIYQHGAIAKNRTIGKTLASQFSNVMSHGIELDSLSGINEELRKFKVGHNDIDLISINDQDVSIYHSGANLIGLPKVRLKDFINISNALETLDGSAKTLELTVSLRKSLIYQKIFDSIKTFIVLFVSCLLIAFIFLNAGTAIVNAATPKSSKGILLTDKNVVSYVKEGIKSKLVPEALDFKIQEFFKENRESKHIHWYNDYQHMLLKGDIKLFDDTQSDFKTYLDIIKPAYFLIVFINALSVSFLPKLISELVQQENTSDLASTSLPFTLFYLFFALIMIPAGHYGEKGHIGKLLYLGFATEFIGLLLVAFFENFWIICLGRSLSGMGQGLFLIGLQLYIMVVTPKELRNVGNSIKVIGRNIGLIAGTAIGALLYSYMGYEQIFLLASIASLVSIAYLKFIVPNQKNVNTTNSSIVNMNLVRRKNYIKRMLMNILYISRDPEFLRTLFLVGIIGKIAIAGFVMFMLPLIMFNQGFKAEDVGLALMTFYISGIFATNYTKKFNVSLKITSRILLISSLFCGIGFMFFGLLGINEIIKAPLPFVEPLSKIGIVINAYISSVESFDLGQVYLYLMIVIIGFSNGLLAAPVMTHVTISTRSSTKYTSKNVLTTYTFLERFGHAVGPLLGLQLFYLAGNSTLAMTVFGIFTIVTGLIFILFSKKSL